MSSTTDPILSRAASGDHEAIEALVHSWSRAIRRWTLAGMGDTGQADDAAQDALIRMLRALPTVDVTRPLGPWLRALVRNTCIDHQRRQARMRTRQDPLGDTATMSPSPATRVDMKRGAHRAFQALSILTERQREVLLAVDYDGKTPTEVADELNLAAGTVRALLFKARRTLRLELLRQDPEIAALLGGLT